MEVKPEKLHVGSPSAKRRATKTMGDNEPLLSRKRSFTKVQDKHPKDQDHEDNQTKKRLALETVQPNSTVADAKGGKVADFPAKVDTCDSCLKRNTNENQEQRAKGRIGSLAHFPGRMNKFLLKVKTLEEDNFRLQDKLEEADSKREDFQVELEKVLDERISKAHEEWNKKKEETIQTIRSELQEQHEQDKSDLMSTLARRCEEVQQLKKQLEAKEHEIFQLTESLKTSVRQPAGPSSCCPLSFSTTSPPKSLGIKNGSNADVSLAGWGVESRKLGHRVELPPEAMLAAGSTALLWWDAAYYQPGSNSFHWSSCGGSVGNSGSPLALSGDYALLIDPEGEIVDQIKIP